jgi:nitrate reductase gamma subunit
MTFILGMIFRYKYDQFSWTAKSSELIEKKKLMIGSSLFHIGIIFVFFGHVGGLLIPIEVTERIGISDHMYHTGAVAIGGIFGFMSYIGIIILTWRRLSDVRVRSISTFSDIAINIILIIIMTLGISSTFFGTMNQPDFNYRETISIWFRQIFILQPDGKLMSGIPLIYKFHVLSAFALIALFPFSRLVHAFSLPIGYIKRRYIIYQKNVRK